MERRRYSRVSFSAETQLEQQGEQLSAELCDISLNGLLLRMDAEYDLRADLPATVRIKLSDVVEISMQVKLVHVTTHYFGFECISIDVDSLTHLRRVIELNVNMPGASERVLAELKAAYGS